MTKQMLFMNRSIGEGLLTKIKIFFRPVRGEEAL